MTLKPDDCGTKKNTDAAPSSGHIEKAKMVSEKKSYTAALPTPDSLEAPFQATLNTGRAEKSTTLKVQQSPPLPVEGDLALSPTEASPLGQPLTQPWDTPQTPAV